MVSTQHANSVMVYHNMPPSYSSSTVPACKQKPYSVGRGKHKSTLLTSEYTLEHSLQCRH